MQSTKPDKVETRAAKKRLLSPEIERNKPAKQVNNRNNKRPKNYKITAADINDINSMMISMKQSIDNLSASQTSVESKLSEISTEISKKIDTEVQSLRNTVEDFKSKISDNVMAIIERLDSHVQRLDNNKDDINRLRYANDLRVTGIPFAQNENLFEIFCKKKRSNP